MGNFADRAVLMQEVLKQVTAMFEGSMEDFADAGLGVEILEVAPCGRDEPWVSVASPIKKAPVIEEVSDAHAVKALPQPPVVKALPQPPIKKAITEREAPVSVYPASGNDREEAESLRSTRSGLVRKMVNVFSRGKV